MTNFEKVDKSARRPFGLNWMPHIRIAIPALARQSYIKKKAHCEARLERDDLMELFQSDLSGMKTLKSQKAQHNVIQLRPYRVANFTGLDRAA
ncbi:hypothetical protein BCF46_0174 [Litoreibacter meonggei]|uniref:Uncharacterized protein n=1 Tax=Litoreibacter meonggei TaxID=1049199 RepID=A0A497X240_9RHOB|nr:hypothetical protein [Litoreibacter meonggei]RLJ59982.1 hypothetical protein BCF46_0174 [Litoreibacter meonggei]